MAAREKEIHQCPNCKQETLHCTVSDRVQVVKCRSCKASSEIWWNYRQMAAGHEEHSYSEAVVRLSKKKKKK